MQNVLTAMTVSSERSLLFCGSKGQIAVFDTVTSARQHLIPIPLGYTPTLLQILPGGTRLAIVCGEWAIYIHSLDVLKTTSVMNLGGTKKSRLVRPVLASISMGVSGGAHPTQVLFVANVGKDSVRTIHVGLRPDKDKAKLPKELTPGFKLPLQKGKGVVALVAHPFAPSITILTANGELQGYDYVNSALLSTFQYSSACPLSHHSLASLCHITLAEKFTPLGRLASWRSSVVLTSTAHPQCIASVYHRTW